MQNKILLTICFISLFIVSAEVMLAQRYYTMDEGQFMMLSDRGDFRLSTVFPGEGFYTAQIGFSPIKHIGLTGAYVRDRSSREVFRFNGPSTARVLGDYFNFGLGGYYFMKSKKKEDRQFYLSEQLMMEEGFLFDLYAGYRFGSLENIYYQNSRSIFDTHKIYLQLGIHWTFRIGTLSYAIRGVYLDFANGRANGPLDDPILQDLFDGGIQDNTPFNFYESSFRYQIGIKQVRIYTSISTNFGDGDKRPINQKRTVITAGLIFELDELFGKKSSVEEMPSEG